MDFTEVIKTDVLVIGSGGAGLCAAISAKREGADVLMVGKSRMGRANNTAISGGAFAVATGLRSVDDTPELHVKDTLVSGRWINRPGMVRTMADGAAEQLENLVSCGVSFQKIKEGKLRIVPVPGHSAPRHVIAENSFGTGFTFPLSRNAESAGVKFLPNVFVERLCRSEQGNIAGALILDPVKQDSILISAKSIVLASGGGGQIYSQTNNAPGTTGDGYALAFRLGLPLIDMEFVQCYPTVLSGTSLSTKIVLYEALIFRGGARLFNSRDEDIILRHNLDDPAKMTRDALTLAIAKEIEEGRGISGAVWLDLSSISSQKFEKFSIFVPKSQKGKTRFPVSPAVHHFMGGLLVNNQGETSIEGLYAAGEVNGGVHGANRLGGNALTETWVFGDLTGRLAAQYSMGKKQPAISEAFKDIESEIGSRAKKEGKFFMQDLQKELKRLMWEKAGILRSKEKLSALIKDIENLKQRTAEFCPNNLKEYIKKRETENMLIAGESTARSALFRKESRGAHFRSDFPDEGGDEWIKNTLIKGDDLEMKVESIENK